MPRGPSGRIVIEVDPELKTELYAKLEHDRLTLKDWFVGQVERFLYDDVQLALRFDPNHASKETAEK